MLTNWSCTKSLFFEAALVTHRRNRVFRDCAEVLVQLLARTEGLYSSCLHIRDANVRDIAESFNPRVNLTFGHSEALMLYLDSVAVAVYSKLADDAIVGDISRNTIDH